MTMIFRAYDFESDPKWKAYQANLEIPAGVAVDQVLTKFKAKWYKREIVSPFLMPSSLLFVQVWCQ